MPLPDTIMTFSYFLTQVSAMKPAYVQLVRYISIMDVPLLADPSVKQAEDTHPTQELKRGTPHDVLAVYGGIIKPLPFALKEHAEEQIRGPAMPAAELDKLNPTPTRLFVNGGLQPDEAEELVAAEVVDAAVFGTLWIGTPDLEYRIEKGIPVNMQPDVKTFYGAPGDDQRVGYTTFPFAEEAKL